MVLDIIVIALDTFFQAQLINKRISNHEHSMLLETIWVNIQNSLENNGS